MNEHKKNKISGITLIALVVTVIVLLILAGISVSMLSGNNGIINKAGSAKEQTEIAKEKEAIGTATLQAANKGKFGDITQENLQQQINNEFGEEKNAKVYDEEENFLVLIENRLYKVDKDGNVELSESNFEFPKKEFLAQLSNNELGTSEDKPYEIRCIEDLLDFSLTVNGITIENNEIKYTTGKNFSGKHVSLVKNLDFKLPLSYENAERIDYGDINQDGKVEKLLTELTTGKGWIPIGGNVNNSSFNGKFNGNNHKISKLYMNNTNESSGLFGYVVGGSIKCLGVIGNINCSSSWAGGISGNSYRFSMENCYFEGKIYNDKTSSITGGLIGSGGTLKQCYCSGEITGVDNVGGIIGYGGTIENSYNSSNITGHSLVGGISGRNATISDCYNIGKVSGNNDIGGIIGYRGYDIINCYNTGEISGNSCIGGIEGMEDNGKNKKIFQCYNTGIISGTTNVGGILGCSWILESFTIEQCYNNGKISGNNNVAGISGSYGGGSNCNVLNCYNSGNITGSKIGGIVFVGKNSTKVISCYNIGKLEGTTKYEIANSGIIKNCYYLGNQENSIGNEVKITSEQLKTLAPTLDKAYTIDEETGTVTISETEIQNVWKEDTENKNEGYPIFKWQ